MNSLVGLLSVLRDQDLAEALDSGSSDMEMDKGLVQVQEQSAQHRAKMWKVGVQGETKQNLFLFSKQQVSKQLFT